MLGEVNVPVAELVFGRGSGKVNERGRGEIKRGEGKFGYK